MSYGCKHNHHKAISRETVRIGLSFQTSETSEKLVQSEVRAVLTRVAWWVGEYSGGVSVKGSPTSGHMAYAANPNAYSPILMKVSEEASKI